MGTGKQRRKGNVAKNKKFHRLFKPKHYTRDADQIFSDNQNESTKHRLLNQPVDESLPGFGQFYCLQCARYFTEQNSLDAHVKTKVHKKALKRIQTQPYTVEEAEKIQY